MDMNTSIVSMSTTSSPSSINSTILHSFTPNSDISYNQATITPLTANVETQTTLSVLSDPNNQNEDFSVYNSNSSTRTSTDNSGQITPRLTITPNPFNIRISSKQLQQQNQSTATETNTLLFNNNNTKFSSEFTMPARLEYLLDMPPCNSESAAMHGWNPDDRSLNIFVKESDPFTLHRHPVAQSTDCIRTKVGYTKGMHLWELTWNSRQRGTHAIIGVANDKSPLHCVGYQSLIGSNIDSYGWDLGRNRACHNTKNSGVAPPVYPKSLKPDENFIIPDKFQMCLDMDEGTLSFLVDGQYLGPAFQGLRGKKLHPIVSTVWGHAEITMKYLNGLDCMFFFYSCIKNKIFFLLIIF